MRLFLFGLLIGILSCTHALDFKLYRWSFHDGLFWYKKEKNEFLTQEQANGFYCMSKEDLKKVTDKLIACGEH